MKNEHIKYLVLFGLAALLTVTFIVSKEVWFYLPGHHDHGRVAFSYNEGSQVYACENHELDLITCNSERFWPQLLNGGFEYYWIIKYVFVEPWQTVLIFIFLFLGLILLERAYQGFFLRKK